MCRQKLSSNKNRQKFPLRPDESAPADSAAVAKPAPAVKGETSTEDDKGEEVATTAAEADVKEVVETGEEQKPASESQPAPIDST
ncbi:hypothetical protein N7510_002240 [Penicillium lagena]|uniref:uncharacterized protein n=1 Tax=Penicillium lagena TaxID=94218 RepID=UPI0025422A6B|nr:uncharacterized protein N7510_002240 [Penicillium lagena]KAJ5625931.1 hypothetical protein N7510_002240 [Penicillium lagena]